VNVEPTTKLTNIHHGDGGALALPPRMARQFCSSDPGVQIEQHNGGARVGFGSAVWRINWLTKGKWRHEMP